jgi:glyoxylase-like metal-dependent hydrolase (beta-lactamase superfamily II)
MKLSVINTGFFKLDGGAMFGVVPKSIWNRTSPADDKNLCTWAMRCLLIEDGNKLILIDNGIGDKQSPEFFKHYYLHGNDTLLGSMKNAGYSPSDVTDMFMTHLHFDHCGGGVRKDGDKFSLVFPNATYWSNKGHWKWATEPNPREKASFLTDNILPIQQSGHLKLIEQNGSSPLPQFDLLCVDGHTEQMMLPLIRYKGKTVCYVSDLIPSVSHVPLVYVMGYDTRPLITMEEKGKFLDEAAAKEYVLFFEHDPLVECCTVKATDKGVRVDRTFALSEVI